MANVLPVSYTHLCENFGKTLSVSQLSEIFLKLQEEGAHNLNLVTPTQYLPFIIEALDNIKKLLSIPVIYNCGGYERPEVISLLKDYIDIYMPDLKYYDASLSFSYSKAKDYFSFASKAIQKMIEQTGVPTFNKEGILQKGVLTVSYTHLDVYKRQSYCHTAGISFYKRILLL